MKLTNENIEALVISEEYHRFEDTTITICCLKLKGEGGYTIGVTGESACIDPRNFNEEIGKQEARKRAIDKLWELEGYHSKKMFVAYHQNTLLVEDRICLPEWFDHNNFSKFLGFYDPEKDVIDSVNQNISGRSLDNIKKLFIKSGCFFIVKQFAAVNEIKYSPGDLIATDSKTWHHWPISKINFI